MLLELAAQVGETDTLMIDATHLKAHRTASSLRGKEGAWPPDRARPAGGLKRTSAASPPDTTDAQTSSYPPAHSLPSSCSGYEA